MEELIQQLYPLLQKLTGLYRKLIQVVRTEREALVLADLKAIEIQTFSKQALVQDIANTESVRLKLIVALAKHWGVIASELTLSVVILKVQEKDPKKGELFRTAYNALTVLMQHILNQNNENKILVEKTLYHLNQMKKNLFEESLPKAEVYGQQGEKVKGKIGVPVSRLLSTEA